MSTIKDVARLANVSVATVSRVMNNSPKASAASREVVQKAMAELGYTPNANARALVSQTCDTMGVVVGDVADPFFGALVKGVSGIAVEQNLHLLMGNGFHKARQEREAIELLIGKRCMPSGRASLRLNRRSRMLSASSVASSDGSWRRSQARKTWPRMMERLPSARKSR